MPNSQIYTKASEYYLNSEATLSVLHFNPYALSKLEFYPYLFIKRPSSFFIYKRLSKLLFFHNLVLIFISCGIARGYQLYILCSHSFHHYISDQLNFLIKFAADEY
jgi:hypothetical protein